MSASPHEKTFSGRIVLLGMAALVLLALGAGIIISKAGRSLQVLPVLGDVPAFAFVEQSGRPFGLEDLKGRISVVNFFFTSCPGICPVMAARYSEMYDLYEGSDQLQLVSITVDPTRDSLPVLRQYAADHGVTDDRWVFLREPDMAAVIALSERGFMLAADSLPYGHSGKFALVDSKGQIRGYYSHDDEEAQRQLRLHIRALVRALK